MTTIVPLPRVDSCPVCGFRGDRGPSDHQPWCPCFMRGAIAPEGQRTIFDELAEPAPAPTQRRTRRERLEARAERRRGWAQARDRDGDAGRQRVHQIADRIPFGQPILVGHHSEAGARADQRRIEQGMRSAVDSWAMANRHEHKADGIERQLRTSIFSDDADAVDKLTAKVAGLEAQRDRVKAYNVSCRNGAPDESLLSEAQRRGLLTLSRVGHLGKNGAVPSYELTNLGANIRRNRERLEQIQRDKAAQASGDRGRGKPMLSRYAGECPNCGEAIERGAPIIWYRSTREAVHERCPDA